MGENLLHSTRTAAQPLPGISVACTTSASVTVTVVGDVDTVGAPVLDAALDVVWDDDPRDLVLDLTGVPFLSVAGLHILYRASQTARRRGGRFTVRTRSRQIERMLAWAGVTETPDGELCPVIDLPGQQWPETGADDDPPLRTVRVAAAWCSADSLRSSMESMCAAALATIPGTDGAGIVLADGDRRRPDARAATDGRASALDAVWEGLRLPRGDDGHVNPAWVDGAVLVGDLGRDPRWPELAARAVELRVRSVLCLGIGAARPLGALTLYSDRPGAFTGEAVRLGRFLAAVASIALSAAQGQEQLTRALSSRDVIGQAKGILMERHKITAAQAFLVLSRASSLSNTKLAVVAARTAETGEL